MKPPQIKSTHIIPILLALFFLAAVSGWIAEFLTEWMWHASEGYGDVFLKGIALRGATGAFFAVLIFIVVAGNTLWALSKTRDGMVRVHPMLAQTPLAQLLDRSTLRRLILILSAVVATLFGLGTSAWWSDVMLYLNASPFGFIEPIFERDASHYVFTLPMLLHIRNLLVGVILLSALLSTGVYVIRGSLGVTIVFRENRIITRKPRVAPEARRHLAALFSSLVVLAGFACWIHRFELLHEQGARIAGPGYKEIYGTFPLLLLLSIVCFGAALSVYYHLLRQNWRGVGLTLILPLLVAGIEAVYPGMLQRFSVLPNEFNREREFIVNHIAATRAAHSLDKVEERFLSGEATLTRADIDANQDTIRNIRLWDHEPLLETFGQVQEIRTYYQFYSVDNDRYVIDGQLTQTMLSPRELAIDDLPNRTWVNERLTYTHGYGVAMGPVNRMDAEGLPELFIKDLPPSFRNPELAITRPEIYFGEESHEPVFVRTSTDEFDYPAGSENVFNQYQEDGGLPIGNLWRRLLFAIRFGDLKILLTSDLTSESRVLMHRRVVERVNRIAPFFYYDNDPYLVIHEGRLVWILDGYTATKRFPYALSSTSVGNYIRNSVKVTVDAYSGRMTFYATQLDEPLSRAWAGVFPDLLKPLAEMPEGLRAHLRHPEFLFGVQAHVFSTYHMDDPQMFYSQEDAWQVPRMPPPGGDPSLGERAMKPYFTIMKLPGGDKPEFIQILPFTPHGKDNLAAWMAARSDQEHYGQLVVYRFPKERMVFGPRQIASRINQDDAIAPQLTLWNQQESNVMLGTLLIIPVRESLLYVQPLYLRADKGKIPELKRVIVGYESGIVMAATLDEAVNALFPVGSVEGTPPAPVTESNPALSKSLPELSRNARSAYDAARSAAQAGDWSRFGTELNALGELLIQIETEATRP